MEINRQKGASPVDSIERFDHNFRGGQDPKDSTRAGTGMWQALMAVDPRGWKVLESAINDVKPSDRG